MVNSNTRLGLVTQPTEGVITIGVINLIFVHRHRSMVEVTWKYKESLKKEEEKENL